MKQPKLMLNPKSKGKTRIDKIMKVVIDYQFGDETEQEARRKFMKMLEIENKVNPYGLIRVEWKKDVSLTGQKESES